MSRWDRACIPSVQLPPIYVLIAIMTLRHLPEGAIDIPRYEGVAFSGSLRHFLPLWLGSATEYVEILPKWMHVICPITIGTKWNLPSHRIDCGELWRTVASAGRLSCQEIPSSAPCAH
jgi:hypothetical protein